MVAVADKGVKGERSRGGAGADTRPWLDLKSVGVLHRVRQRRACRCGAGCFRKRRPSLAPLHVSGVGWGAAQMWARRRRGEKRRGRDGRS